MAKPTEAEWKAHEDYVLDLKLMRDHLRSTDVENQLSKDRLILTIGGGALVLTSTLLTDVFKDLRGYGFCSSVGDSSCSHLPSLPSLIRPCIGQTTHASKT